MKLDNDIWVRLENKASPGDNEEFCAIVPVATRRIMEWIIGKTLQRKMTITIGRRYEDLGRRSSVDTTTQMLDELEALLAVDPVESMPTAAHVEIDLTKES